MNDIVSLDLVKLAEDIREEHQLCVQSMRHGVEHALKVGELLLVARGRVNHGEWEDWVNQNCDFTPRMARNYIVMFRHSGLLKPETISEMTLTGALESVKVEIRKQLYSGVETGVSEWEQAERERKEEKKRWKLENEQYQVKEYLDAVKAFVQVVRDVVSVAEFGKFSPEGARFTMRRHEQLRQELERLEDVFRKALGEGGNDVK